MNIHTRGEVKYLTFKSADTIKGFRTAISTRHGGVSSGETYSSMNLGTGTEDDWGNIVSNYRIFCDAAGFDINRIVLAKQTHSSNVRLVSDEDAGKGVVRERDYTDVDALITDTEQLALVIHTADCVPVAIMDPVHRAAGNAHCGWRGSFDRLAEKTLQSMNDSFGTDAGDVFVTIGPCICVSCYEVSEALYEDFMQKFGYDDCILKKAGKFFLNLAGINRRTLIDAGVPKENISVSDICTCCCREDMYSHRGLGPRRGIIGSFIQIESSDTHECI